MGKGFCMKKYFYLLWPILLFILLDQFSKSILLYTLTGSVPLVGNAWHIVPTPYMIGTVTNFFNLVFTWNPGTSFSLFRDLGESLPILIIVLTGFVIGFLFHHLLFRAKDKLEKWALLLIIGGALGNLIDRIRFGAVIDFLDFHLRAWHWPAFNIADVFISVGVGLYILNLFITRKK